MENSNSNKKVKIAVGVVAAIAILLGIVLLCGNNNTESANSNEPQVVVTNSSAGSVMLIDDRLVDKSEAVQTQKNPLADRNVYFAGYVDATLSKTSTVALENLPENEEFYLKYTVTNIDTNEVVFETNLIPSGQCVMWTPGETLEVGTYNLQLLASPYYEKEDGNFLPLTAGSNVVQYTIAE